MQTGRKSLQVLGEEEGAVFSPSIAEEKKRHCSFGVTLPIPSLNPTVGFLKQLGQPIHNMGVRLGECLPR